MMSLTFGLFTQVSGSGPLGPLVFTGSRALHKTEIIPQGDIEHIKAVLSPTSAENEKICCNILLLGSSLILAILVVKAKSAKI